MLLSQQDIFQGTLWENIVMGNESINLDTVKTLATKVGLNDFISTCKDGYETLLDPTGKKFIKKRSASHSFG